MLGFFALASVSLAAPTIDNFRSGETLRYSLAIVRGTAGGESVRVDGTEYPVVGGRYIALASLKPGENRVRVQAGDQSKQVVLRVVPPESRYRVVPVWVVGKDGTGRHYGTLNEKDQDVSGKVDTLMRAIQSFSAEAMNDLGYGRKTFNLEIGSDGRSKLRTVRLDKTDAELRAMTDGQIWSTVYDHLKARHPESTERWVALVAATDYDPKAQKASAHLALGGGALACFGTGLMDFWPRRTSDVVRFLSDAMPVDPAVRFDDSGYRSTAWGNMATTYGAVLHELGHALGLPHTADPQCIMSRGFDHINRAFTLVEPASKRNKDAWQPAANQASTWDPHFAARLNWSRWFQPDAIEYKSNEAPKIEIKDGKVIASSSNGLRVVGAESDSSPAVYREFLRPDAPTVFEWPVNWLRGRMKPGETYRITSMDSFGNQATIEDKVEPKS